MCLITKNIQTATLFLLVSGLAGLHLHSHPEHYLDSTGAPLPQSPMGQNTVQPLTASATWNYALEGASRIFNLAYFLKWMRLHQASPDSGATLKVRIRDAGTGTMTPVRIRLTNSNGDPVGADQFGMAVPGQIPGLPAAAIGVQYGRYDHAEGFAFQPDGAFYVDGSFEMPLPPGDYRLTISKGYEYVQESETFTLQAGDSLSRDYSLKRWIDMPARGWYSGDDHIHIRRSPRENPLILDWIAAEDVHVGILLQMGDFWTTFYAQYGWGEEGRYQEGNHLLTSGQEEPRTPELGHTISLGATELVRFRDHYYSYDKVFDRVRELGGVTGYAHQGMSFHGPRGMTLDVLQNKIDFLELMQFCVQEGPLALQQYYRFLDLGYQLTALGGSDFPWCGRGPRFGLEEGGSQIGDARFYTYTGGPLRFDEWLEGVKAGHTFVTSGPMLEFTVNDLLPGESLEVEPGSRLRVSARAYGHPSLIPLSRLEIVAHGKVVGEVSVDHQANQSQEKLSLEIQVPVERGIWIAARAQAGPTQVAHTTPVYVTVDGGGFHNPETVADHIQLSREYLDEIRGILDRPQELENPESVASAARAWLYAGFREDLKKRVAEVEAQLDEMARKLVQ